MPNWLPANCPNGRVLQLTSALAPFFQATSLAEVVRDCQCCSCICDFRLLNVYDLWLIVAVVIVIVACCWRILLQDTIATDKATRWCLGTLYKNAAHNAAGTVTTFLLARNNCYCYCYDNYCWVNGPINLRIVFFCFFENTKTEYVAPCCHEHSEERRDVTWANAFLVRERVASQSHAGQDAVRSDVILVRWAPAKLVILAIEVVQSFYI